MRKVIVGLLIFMAGWALGWYAHHLRGPVPEQSAQPVNPVLPDAVPTEKAAAVSMPAVSGHADSIGELLARNAFVITSYSIHYTKLYERVAFG